MYDCSLVLRQLRAEHKYTQEEIAKLIGVSRISYSLWETSQRSPSKRYCEKICDIYNIDLNYLLGFSPKKNSNSDGINVVVFHNNELTEDVLILPTYFLDKSKFYWAEINDDTKNIAIYERETKKLVATICKF